jgi:hypothetical protein
MLGAVHQDMRRNAPLSTLSACSFKVWRWRVDRLFHPLPAPLPVSGKGSINPFAPFCRSCVRMEGSTARFPFRLPV